jgi:hypothetical protein
VGVSLAVTMKQMEMWGDVVLPPRVCQSGAIPETLAFFCHLAARVVGPV